MTKIVFTNGCFDIIHPGHIDILERAKKLGTKLVVGINSDASVRAIKGNERPFVDEESRKAVLLGLKAVDEVYIFEEFTPERLIKQVKPDVLVKGGDWKIEEIVGADFVAANGGEVYSLPLKGAFSSSSVIDKIKGGQLNPIRSDLGKDSLAFSSLKQHIKVFESLLSDQINFIEDCANLIDKTFQRGNKLLLCGNGGSAANAQHIAAEFVGKYAVERPAFPAVALTTDTSALTALANDYDYERIFARQVEALTNDGDCLIALSTSGKSANVIAAVMTARRNNCNVIGLTGADGKKLASLCDAAVLVPSETKARIQEAHIAIAHIWCETVDFKMRENARG